LVVAVARLLTMRRGVLFGMESSSEDSETVFHENNCRKKKSLILVNFAILYKSLLGVRN